MKNDRASELVSAARWPKSMDLLPGKTISSVPKLANRTPFAFVIDSFLVRAANYSVGHRDRQHVMLLDKLQYFSGNTGVGTDIAMVHFPVAHFSHICILGRHDADGDLCCSAQVRTIERDRRNRPTPQPLSRLLA